MSNPTIERDRLKTVLSTLDDSSDDFVKKYNIFLNNIELYNNMDLKEDQKTEFLYPSLDDEDFTSKISKKKEFYDYRNRQQVVDNIEEYADQVCNARFELAPHQLLVKNFLSFYTPYNSILLYHGLGTGKTCSAIGIAEETRTNLRQLNINKKIIIVASPNVQDNFRMQLFDERRLEYKNGGWNIENCVGNTFLDELNITAYRDLSRTSIIKQINALINQYYIFYGYTEFANTIVKTAELQNATLSQARQKSQSVKQLQAKFADSLIIIDEVQNIRSADDDRNKLITQQLNRLVDVVDDLKLVLLSATPLYNNYQEIVWLVNLLNKNDKRSQIELSDVFDKNGDFVVDPATGRETGKALLERKARGYISFVKGDNPYTFPYRIYPDDFDAGKSVKNLEYPKMQLNGRLILEPLQHSDIYINEIGEYQQRGYDYIIDYIKNQQIDAFQQDTKNDTNDDTKDDTKNDTSDRFKNLDRFGYTLLQKPIEALNIIYPSDELDDTIGQGNYGLDPSELIGKAGLNRLMGFQPPSAGTQNTRSGYYFKPQAEAFGNIFARENIGKYSSKIASILDNIADSDGIIMVYSQYIDGGIIPVALALESMGITRYGDTSNLFSKAPTESIDYLEMKPKSALAEGADFQPAKYIMITGDKTISPANLQELKYGTNPENRDGSRVKVILISQAAAEGLDFKFIRQLHILDPWYNMNRIEQIIGRGVRQCSHKDLPLAKRNVQIFLHGSIMSNNAVSKENEPVDLYVYRLAEQKAIQIGHITRILKEVSIDCVLNSNQQNFREIILNKSLKIKLSNRELIEYRIGDRPYSAACDYMDDCYYKCSRTSVDLETPDFKPDLSTYSERHIVLNQDRIIQYIKQLYRDRFFYYHDEIVKLITMQRDYSVEQIDSALAELVTNVNQFITDKYERTGRLSRVQDLYVFQPVELDNVNESIYNRSTPIDYKRPSIAVNIAESMAKDDKRDLKDEKKDLKDEKKDLKDERKDKRDDKRDEKKDLRDLKDDKKDEKKDLKDLEDIERKAEPLLKAIQLNYNKVVEEQILLRGETDYYKSLSVVAKYLQEDHGFAREMLHGIAMHHIVESLEYADTIIILNYLFSMSRERMNEIETRTLEYFKERILLSGDQTISGIALQKNGALQIVVKDRRSGLWVPAESEDLKDLDGAIKGLKSPISGFNRVLGYISSFKGEFNIFKVKQLDKKRNKGARCDQTGKSDAITLLNAIIGENVYTAANTKRFNQNLVCILQEIYLRVYDLERKDGVRWFLYPGEALINDIEKLSR